MILASRRRSYRPRQLDNLLERRRALFEHWTHDASVIPMSFYPHWRLRFRRDADRLRARWRSWRRAGFEERFADVLERIREHGPVMARDFEGGRQRTEAGWWDWHPSKTALEFLWRTGALAISRREGFQKVFDLAERVVPEAYRSMAPGEEETLDWACRARSTGSASPRPGRSRRSGTRPRSRRRAPGAPGSMPARWSRSKWKAPDPARYAGCSRGPTWARRRNGRPNRRKACGC